jgi:hypothetical protein
MLLFIHGIQQSAGAFLPLIKSLIGSGHDFDDKFLLDSFCLWVPGYDKKDFEFDYRFLEGEIFEFMHKKKDAQNEIASELIFSTDSLPVKVIKDDKVNIIGCDIGGGLALEFLSKNVEHVASISLIDCGAYFGTLRAKWLTFNTKLLLNNTIAKNQIIYESENNTYKKNFLGNLLEYPSGKGVGSYIKILEEYNFDKTFNRMSLDQQNQIYKTPINAVVDKTHGLSNNSSIKKLQKIFDKSNNYTNTKHTIIDSKTKKNFTISIFKFSNYSILDSSTAKEISANLINFYHHKTNQ